MEIKKELIEQRMMELDRQEKQFWADLNYVLGAKKECEYWLEKLSEEQKKEG